MIKRTTFTSVIHNRGFLNLWINQILVQLSFNSLNFALIIWIFQLTHSNVAVSALLFAIYLPTVLFGLFSGILVDLIDRRKIILLIDVMLSFLFLSLIFFKESFGAILVITFFMNTLSQFYAPAEASAIPLIVHRKQLLAANSIFSATLYSTFLLGFGLAGPLINHVGISFVFGLGSILLVTASLLALTFPSITSKADKEGRSLLLAVKKGNIRNIARIGLLEISRTLKLIRGKLPVFTSIFILAGVQMVIGVLAVLVPGFLETSLHIKATDASYVLVIPLGLGIILGGLILGKYGAKLIRRRLVGRAILLGGLLFLMVGMLPILTTQPLLSQVLVFGSFLLGIAMVSILVPTQTVLQENTPDSSRGKVFASLGVAMAGLSLIPVFLAGILADVFGVSPIFMGLGVIITLIGLFGLHPSLFFSKRGLPYNVREFLGLGHWKKDVS